MPGGVRGISPHFEPDPDKCMNRSPNLPDDPQFAISLRIVTDGDGVGFPYDPAFKT